MPCMTKSNAANASEYKSNSNWDDSITMQITHDTHKIRNLLPAASILHQSAKSAVH